MDDAAIENLAARVAKATVSETLSALGVDMTKPQDVQRDFAWLRSARTYTGLAFKTVFLGAVAGVLGWFQFKR